MKPQLEYALKVLLRKVWRRLIPEDEMRAIVEQDYNPCVMVSGPVTYNKDGLTTVLNADFQYEKRFRQAYEAGKATGSWGTGVDGKPVDIEWRVHIVLWAAAVGSKLDGDFVECGVNRGGYARAILEYLDLKALNKTFYLLDTFCGLVPNCISNEERRQGIKPGQYDECYEDVLRTFSSFPVKIIRGVVPDTLPQITTSKVAYVSLDMNCAAPELAAAEYLWPRMVPGAMMVLDDYGWPRHAATKKAFDQFAAEKRVPLLSLPTGQGIIMKI